MRVLLFLSLLFSLAFCQPHSCNTCDQNCRNKYDNTSSIDACILGCHASPGLEAQTDDFNVNLNCEQYCKNFSTDDLKSACYGGCTYIPMLSVNKPTQTGSSNDSFLASILRVLFGQGGSEIPVSPSTNAVPSGDDDKNSDDGPIVRETHIRIFLPENAPLPEHMMDDEEMQMMMNIMHGSDGDEMPNNMGAIKLAPGPLPQPPVADGYYMDDPNFARNFCFRARAALHHLATHPLFMASIILMFISSLTLLIFACHRLNARRTRQVTFQRQYRKMPAFFKSPSMRVRIMSPQPPQYDDDEAPILPTKEPIA